MIIIHFKGYDDEITKSESSSSAFKYQQNNSNCSILFSFLTLFLECNFLSQTEIIVHFEINISPFQLWWLKSAESNILKSISNKETNTSIKPAFRSAKKGTMLSLWGYKWLLLPCFCIYISNVSEIHIN